MPGNQTQIIFVIKVEEDRSDEEAESESYNESIEDINPILNKLKMRIEHFEERLLELSKKQNSGSLTFYISYLKFHCRIFTKIMLPSIPAIVKRHWRTMMQDLSLAEIFPKPSLVSYKRAPNICDRLFRAKVPQSQHSDQK